MSRIASSAGCSGLSSCLSPPSSPILPRSACPGPARSWTAIPAYLCTPSGIVPPLPVMPSMT